MQFNDFRAGVETWANMKGIYEHSSEYLQQSKALEELHEVQEAQTREDLMMELGDVAACIINSAHLGMCTSLSIWTPVDEADLWDIAHCIMCKNYSGALAYLRGYAIMKGIDLEDCFEPVLHKLQSRRGKMIDGLFVKEGD